MWVNPGETAGDGIDNDGNGFVDDVNGFDFYNSDGSVFDGEQRASQTAALRWLCCAHPATPSNSQPGVHPARRPPLRRRLAPPAPPTGADSHGTHVAGTIGAAGSAGLVGVNWSVKMISAKFLGPNGGSTAGAVAALNYLVDLKLKKNLKIVATSNSWGGGGFSQALYDAIARSNAANMLFIAAAGNSERFWPRGPLLHAARHAPSHRQQAARGPWHAPTVPWCGRSVHAQAAV
jgi:subtilisin family serine protease